MIAPLTYQSSMKINTSPVSFRSSGINQIFAAAIVNRQFCEMLLNNPNEALKNGYLGETFLLSKEEWDLIVSIRADSLSDLAKKVNRALGR